MSLHSHVLLVPQAMDMDTENFVSLLCLAGLLIFFYFAFSRLLQLGGEKRNDFRMSYGSSGAA